MTLDQEFDQATLPAVREKVLAYAIAAGMTGDRAADAVIAAHELAANAVRHGGGTGRIRLHVTDGELIFQVSDPGPAAGNGHIQAARQAGSAPEPSWPYQPGHGLWLARHVADRISVVSGPAGTLVTAVFVLARAPPAGPVGPAPAR